MSGTPQARRCGESDANQQGELIFRSSDGEETVVASADGDGDRAMLRTLLREFGINGRVDCPQSVRRLQQVKITVLGRSTRTGPLPRRQATSVMNRLHAIDGLSAERVPYFSEEGDGHTE